MNLVLLQAGGGSDWMQIAFIGGLFVVFYFFFLRPQQKKAKETKKMQEDLKIGDKIITMGGLHGRIIDSKSTTVVVELSKGNNVEVERTSINVIVPKS